MQTNDRGEFTVLMRKLCAGMDRPPSPELDEAFWDGCMRLSLRQFRIGVDQVLTNFEGKFPKPKQLAKLAYEREADANAEQSRRQSEDQQRRDAQYPKWLAAVNQLFLMWLYREINSKRRRPVVEGKALRSIPDAEMKKRRSACQQLADDFELLEREGDDYANRTYLRQTFDEQMKLIAVENLA